MCLLFNGTEINSNILLLKMIHFSPLMWNCPKYHLEMESSQWKTCILSKTITIINLVEKAKYSCSGFSCKSFTRDGATIKSHRMPGNSKIISSHFSWHSKTKKKERKKCLMSFYLTKGKTLHPIFWDMFRIDLVSKNLLANVFRNCRKRNKTMSENH